MITDILRTKFLDFFKNRGHKIVKSDLLVPKDDPTLLFTSAVMNQFKKQFMGNITDFTRAASCQKCLRTGDLDEVGNTAFHHTFFEMLGNFSFGDYFKEDAIFWAWEFLTKELKIDSDKLKVSVYKDDKEAFAIWSKKIGLNSDRISLLGEHNNFWPADAPSAGPNGPCGPCSEIFFDKGTNIGCQKPSCGPACSCGRHVEIWNLVFTQFNRLENGKLDPLPNRNIDTGMGLERMASVMQGVESNFEIDIFKPMTSFIRKQITSGKAKLDTRSINIIADHSRAICFAIVDGVMPSNEKRGYVVRKLIRKSVLAYQNLGIKKEFLYKLTPILSLSMKSVYPELDEQREDVAQIILSEERDFLKILNNSEGVIKEIFSQNKDTGFSAFKLYDTYGIPLEITLDWAEKNGCSIDIDSFDKNLSLQKESSKKQSSMQGDIFVDNSFKTKELVSEFNGYENLKVDSSIAKIFKDNKEAFVIGVSDKAVIVLSATPFYAECGGQVGDTGIIKNESGEFVVLDTKKENNAIIHFGELRSGSLKAGDKVDAIVDSKRRLGISRAHSATHLLHFALRKVLGEHVRQGGSLVEDDRFRFDFTHFEGLSSQDLAKVEKLVKEKIKENYPISTKVCSLDEAKTYGALMFFADKYDETVRMVCAGDFSKELCGGTHLNKTGDVLNFKIIQESSIAKGMRRIEAITGEKADEFNRETILMREELYSIIGQSSDTLKRLEKFNLDFKTCIRKLSDFKLKLLLADKDNFLKSSIDVKGVRVFVKFIPDIDKNILRNFYDNVSCALQDNFAIILATSANLDSVNIIAGVSKDAIIKGLDASKIVKQIASLVSGSGGGRPDFAQAGGKDVAKLKPALDEGVNIIKRLIK